MVYIRRGAAGTGLASVLHNRKKEIERSVSTGPFMVQIHLKVWVFKSLIVFTGFNVIFEARLLACRVPV